MAFTTRQWGVLWLCHEFPLATTCAGVETALPVTNATKNPARSFFIFSPFYYHCNFAINLPRREIRCRCGGKLRSWSQDCRQVP